MSISAEDVKRIGELARLHLDTDEVEHLTSDLNAILQHVDSLRDLGLTEPPEASLQIGSRLTPDPQITGYSAHTLTAALKAGDPSIITRSHRADEGYLPLDAIEMTLEEIEIVCDRIRQLLR